MEGRVLVRALLIGASLAALAALTLDAASCDGGVLQVGALCPSDASAAPSGVSSAALCAPIGFASDGGAYLADGGTNVVIQGGRFLTPAAPTFGQLGYPVNVVVHPRRPFAYVADMDYAGNDPNVRCNASAGARVRGIHVMNIATPGQGRAQVQGPLDVTLPDPPAEAQHDYTTYLCPNGSSWSAPHDASYGMAITQNANPAHLFVATGQSGFVYEFQVDEDAGTLTPVRSYLVGGYTTGLALAADERRLWVVQFVSSPSGDATLVELLLGAEGGTGRTFDLHFQGGYAAAVVPADGMKPAPPGTDEHVYVSGFRREQLYDVDPDAPDDASTTTVTVGSNPEAIVPSADGAYVFVSLSDDDQVAAVRTSDDTVTKSPLLTQDIKDENGNVMRGSSPSALAFEPSTQRLYVARSGDNAVSVLAFDGANLSPVGAIPVGFYPSGLALSDAGLVVTHAKSVSYDWSYATAGLDDAGAEGGPPDAALALASAGFEAQALEGSMLVADPHAAIDSNAVIRNVEAPAAGGALACSGRYPVPTSGNPSPIQHVVLIVRENKTYDFLLGGETFANASGRPADTGGEAYQIDRVRAENGLCGGDSPPCPLVPNIVSLAHRFASHDNFYANSEVSMTGHAWLTASFVNDYLQRAYAESLAGQTFPGWDFVDEVGLPVAEPGPGTFFMQLLRNNVDFLIMGELTGVFGFANGQFVINHLDLGFPGVFQDLSKSDIDRANHAIGRLLDDDAGASFPPFVYMELPRDHTSLAPGDPTPAFTIAENDEATGRVVDAISHSPYCPPTAIFIVEDDPQMGYDHVDYHRTICVVASPWVKRDYSSHVHAAFPSLFRTFELILGIPPLNEHDAFAAPLRDVFTDTPDFTPYTYSSSHVPLAQNDFGAPSLEYAAAAQMRFDEPDLNPLQGEVVWKVLTGSYPPGSRVLALAKKGAFGASHAAPLDPDDR